jgi:chromosome segregation ATPase
VPRAARAAAASGAETSGAEPSDALVVANGADAGGGAAEAAAAPSNSNKSRPCLRKPKTSDAAGAAAAGAAATGAATGEAPANVPPPPNNSSNGSYESDNDSIAEEPVGPSIVASVGDSSLPHLLRIGEDASAEMIELAKQKFLSSGSFNIHGFGSGIRELENLYGVRSQAQIAAMQRAFGVSTMLGTPPLRRYLDQGCKFEGFDLVATALQTRASHLRHALDMDRKSQYAMRNQHQLDWIKDTLKAMKGIGRECTAEDLAVIKPKTKVAAAAVAASKEGGLLSSLFGKSKGVGVGVGVGAGAPCLEDATLLRDLVYLIAMLQGVASPVVHKKLNAIPLQNILDLAAKKNIEGARGKLQIALEALKAGVEANGDEEPCEEFEALLAEIYRMFHGANAEIPIGLSADAILDMISLEIQRRRALLDDLMRMHELEKRIAELEDKDTEAGAAQYGLEQSKRSSEILNKAVQDLQAKLLAAVGREAGLQTALEAANRALTQIRSESESFESRLRATENLGNILNNTVAQLRAEAEAKDQQITDLTATLATTREELARATAGKVGGEAAMAALQGQLEKAENDLRTCQTEKAGLEANVATLNSQIDELNNTIASLRGEVTNTSAKLTNITQGKTAAEARVAALEAKLAALREAQAAAIAEAEARGDAAGVARVADAAAAEVESARQEATTRIAALEADLATARAAQAAANERAEGAQAAATQAAADELNRLRAELDECNARFQREEERIRAADAVAPAHAAQIAELTAQLNAQKSRANTAEATLASARADLEACNQAAAAAKATHEQQLEEIGGQLAAARAAQANSESNKEALAAATARIQSLTEELATKKSAGEEEARGFAEQIAAKNTQIAALEATGQETSAAASTAAEELAARNAQIAAKNTKIAELQRQITAAGAKSATNATAIAEKENKITELQSENNRLHHNIETFGKQISSRNSLIEKERGEAKAALDQVQGDLAAAWDSSRSKAAQIAQLKESLAAAQADTASQKQRANVAQGQMAAHLLNIDEQARKIQEQQAAMAKLTSDKEITNVRIQELLSIILLDREMVEQANIFLEGGEEAAQAEQILRDETCEFFNYLLNVVSIQLARIGGSQSVLPSTAKNDIFALFDLPSFNFEERDLLRELTNLFQEIFKTFGVHKKVDAKNLTGSYPILYQLFGNPGYVIKEGTALHKLEASKRGGVSAELLNKTFFNNIGLVPGSAPNKFVLRAGTESEFHGNNTAHFTLLSVFVIKYIQTLYKTLKAQMYLIGGKCGYDSGGAADVESDDEFLSVVGDATEEVVAEEAAAAGGGGGGGAADTGDKMLLEDIQLKLDKEKLEEEARAVQHVKLVRGAGEVAKSMVNYIGMLKTINTTTHLSSKKIAYEIKYLEELLKKAEELNIAHIVIPVTRPDSYRTIIPKITAKARKVYDAVKAIEISAYEQSQKAVTQPTRRSR